MAETGRGDRLGGGRSQLVTVVAKAHQWIALQLLQLIPDAVQAIEAAMDAPLPPWFGLQLGWSLPVAGVDNHQHDRCGGLLSCSWGTGGSTSGW